MPVVKITSTTGTITSTSYQLLASVTNVTASSQVSVKVNGVSQSFNLLNGKITANLTLQSGSNTIVVTGTNTCGKDAKTIAVTSNPCQAPKLTLVSPLGTTVMTVNSNYDLSLKATGSVLQKNISVKLNGNSIPFNFNSSTKMLTVNVANLTNGVNTVQVSVSNACGNDVVNYKITANLCTSPKVVLTTSSFSKVIVVKSLSYGFTGTVSGITNKNGVALLVNNKPVSFSVSASTGKVSASLLLKEGLNSIVLSATNTCGADSKTLKVEARTCETPVLSALSPKLITSTENTTQTFTLSAKGIGSANEITVRLNGMLVSKLYSNGKITVKNVSLKMGINTLVVTASNKCGTDKVTYSVTRKACNKPNVKLLSTNSNVNTLAFPYSATVTGVSSKQDVVLKVNNKVVSFNLNIKTGQVTSAIVLVEGNNTILLTATNKCGTVSKTHTVKATTCKQPEIKVAYPTNTSITTANSTFTILAIGINVTQSEIKVTNNGANIPFTFNSTNGKITVAVTNMSQGVNNIKIKGTNPCGSSEVNYVLTYTGSAKSGTTSPGTGGKTQKRN